MEIARAPSPGSARPRRSAERVERPPVKLHVGGALATVRCRQALPAERDALVAAAEARRAYGTAHDDFGSEVLAQAAEHLTLLRTVDFVPVISGRTDGDDSRSYTDGIRVLALVG